MKRLALVTASAPLAGLVAFVVTVGSIVGSPTAAATFTTGACSATGARVDGLTPEQQANAEEIAAVALDLGLGKQGVVVGITVALTESTLNNVDYGDMMGPGGTMSSSRGLFQQLNPWGPLADRMNPAKAATMFFTGGQAGQDGLMDIEGWQQMPVPQAAQAVQRSEFTDGSNFAKQLTLGTRVAEALVACAAAAPPAAGPLGPVLVSGAAVTIPDSPHVAEGARGRTIQAPTAELAAGIAAGLQQLGLPYVWGGGTNGGPADDGCVRGGGSNNSCQGLVGFDCSGLTSFVLKHAGRSVATNSGGQRSSGQSVPWAAALPGDILGRPGHVALYLGTIDGTPYILEASTFGKPVHVKATTTSGWDTAVHRHWGGVEL